jgi:uncharacterized protein (TIGR03382 family)
MRSLSALTSTQIAAIADYIAASQTVGVLAASVSDLSFGDQPVGVASSLRSVTVSNRGRSMLTLTQVASTGEFAIKGGTCKAGLALAPRATCTVSLGFTPTALGERSGMLRVTATPQASVTVALKGRGVSAPGALRLSASELEFEGVRVGDQSSPKAITVQNVSPAAVQLAAPMIDGAGARDFAFATNCGASLAAGAACVINVRFAPAAGPARSAASLWVDAGSAGRAMVKLEGKSLPAQMQPPGTQPPAGSPLLPPTADGRRKLSASTPMLSFDPVASGASSAALQAEWTNASGAPVTIAGMRVEGAGFTLAADGCTGMTVPADGSCSVSVRFAPTATGEQQGRIVSMVAGSEDASVDLKATAFASPTPTESVAAPQGGGALGPWALLLGGALLARRRRR